MKDSKYLLYQLNTIGTVDIHYSVSVIMILSCDLQCSNFEFLFSMAVLDYLIFTTAAPFDH